MRTRNKPEYQKKMAEERIELLFKEASKAAKGDAELARKYVKLAKKIAMRYNVRTPKKFKRMCCKYCYSLLAHNSKQRLKGGRLNIKCFSCNKTMRYLYKRKV